MIDKNENKINKALDRMLDDSKTKIALEKEISEGSMYESQKIEITEEFKATLQLMEDSRDHLYITGDAGSGKSTLVQHWLKYTKKRVVVLAPTGVAAVNIKGMTIHSFFRFPPRVFTSVPKVEEAFLDVYKAAEIFLIDEVSMVRADILSMIDKFLRANLKSPYFFAGKQMVMVGDLYQLPPIVQSGADRKYMKDNFLSPYFFSAKPWSKAAFRKLKLTKVFRQKDEKFKQLLNKIKYGTISDAEIQFINKTCYRGGLEYDAVTLCCYNADAARINNIKLHELDMLPKVYNGKLVGMFDKGSCPADPVITLKVGAKVMMLNNDKGGRWVNGTIGTVERLDVAEISIFLETKITVKVQRIEWEQIRYQYDSVKRAINPEVIGKFSQFPLKLAWGMSIHKSQSKTFQLMNIDLGKGAFTTGQTYVAFSRSIELEKIALIKPLRRQDIRVDPIVNRFDQTFDNSQHFHF